MTVRIQTGPHVLVRVRSLCWYKNTPIQTLCMFMNMLVAKYGLQYIPESGFAMILGYLFVLPIGDGLLGTVGVIGLVVMGVGTPWKWQCLLAFVNFIQIYHWRCDQHLGCISRWSSSFVRTGSIFLRYSAAYYPGCWYERWVTCIPQFGEIPWLRFTRFPAKRLSARFLFFWLNLGFNMKKKNFFRNVVTILLFAVVGTLISTGFVGGSFF